MIERLTPEDEMMLWPDEVWPQDIGALVILDGGDLLDGHGRLRREAVVQHVAGRLNLVPRFRQLLYVPARRLGAPLWMDAPAFDVEDHIGTVPVPAPAGDAQILAVTEQLRRRRLNRSRPLWEMWFLTGLPNGRVGLFVRIHHCIADGMAGVATMAAFLDPTPARTAPEARPWTPALAPTEAELLGDDRRRRRLRRRQRLTALAHPAQSAQAALQALGAMRELLAARPVPATSLDRQARQDRNLAIVRSSLRGVKAIAHAHDATVNDVLLTVVAGGLRSLLRSRGEPVEGVVLRTFVPVSLHQGERSQARGNLIAQMVVPLPIGLADPEARLREIAARTAELKTRVRPPVSVFPHRGLVGRLALKLLARQRVNISTTDIPGPEMPLYFAGARLLEVFPMVQILGNNTLAVGAMSYAGQFNAMAVADRDTLPDLAVFTAGLERDLDALEAATKTEPQPARMDLSAVAAATSI